jgi:outer membrane protein OmpA-like peptidoglycan-associated protein
MKIIKLTTTLIASSLLFSACHTTNCYVRQFKRKASKEVGRHNVSVRHDTVRVVYPEVTTFEFNKDELKPEAQQSLHRFAGLLKKYDRMYFIINGYTDNVGTADFNQSLSQRRADNTKAVMEGDGIPAGRMRTNGMGANNPVKSNSTEKGRQANRRVEFLVYDKDNHKKKKKKK